MTTKTYASGIISTSKLNYVDPTRIYIQPMDAPNRRNKRFDMGNLENDLGTMKTSGWNKNQPVLIKRIKGREGFDFELIDGERRLTYCNQLIAKGFNFPEDADPRVHGIPAVIEPETTSDFDLVVRMMTANHGKPFNPAEEMMAVQDLLNMPRADGKKTTLKDVAKATGRSMIHLEHVMATLQADDSVKDAIKDGSVPVALARRVAVKAKGDAAKQKELIGKAKEAKAQGGKKGQETLRRVRDEVEGIQRRKLKSGTAVPSKQLSPQQIKDLAAKMAKEFAAAFELVGGESPEFFLTKVQGDDLLSAVYLMGVSNALAVVQGAKGIKLSL